MNFKPFPDKVYEILKWITLIFLPALNVLVYGVSTAVQYDASVVCAIISAVTVFIGSLIGISNHAYYKNNNEK